MPENYDILIAVSREPDRSIPHRCRQVGRQFHLSARQVKAEKRMSSGLTFLTMYTYSKSISGPSDIGGEVGGGNFIGAPQDAYYMQGDRSVSGFDVTQRFVQTVLYDIPFARGLHGAPKILVGRLASFHHHDLPKRLPRANRL
jgi:hypothetical protein